MTALAAVEGPIAADHFMRPPQKDIQEVRPDRLAEAPEYQREKNRPFVMRLADEWDDSLSQVLLVSQREDGTLVIIDGLHRQAAAKERRPKPWLLCHILHDLSRQEEARLFVELNTRRRNVHIIDRFNAAICAREETACAINAALLEYGFHVAFQGPYTISAVQALEYAHAWEALRPVLGIIKSAWDHPTDAGQKAVYVATSKTMLVALAAFDLVHRDDEGEVLYKEDTLIDLLRDTSPGAMIADATPPPGARFSGKSRPPAWSTIAADITDAYNGTVKRADKLPPFQQPRLPRAQLLISKKQGGRDRAVV